MSSDDVIELGSSDEDPEPAPKRSKPMSNAMVCIPRKLHEVTIKPARLNTSTKPVKPNPISRTLESNHSSLFMGKPVTIKKSPNIKPQIVNTIKHKLNGKPLTIQPSRPKLGVNPYADCPKPILIQNKPGNSKVPLIKSGGLKPLVGSMYVPMLKSPIKIQNPKILNLPNLPSSITVKKTVSNRPVLVYVKNNEQLNKKPNAVGDVLTVELDDEKSSSHKSSPQWYLRPEEQTEIPVFEEENNKEPDEPKLIEITIEDSPVKPVHNKRTHEVGAELAITIDDSPVKAVVTDKGKVTSDSENEHCSSEEKVPPSKKKLAYPKENDTRKTIEIEIDPLVVTNTCSDINDVNVVNIIEDSNASEVNTEKACTTPPKESKLEVKISSPSEFHPVYQSFIDLCFQLENSDDMKKIVEKKIKGYYRQVPKEYTNSEEFTDMVSSKILAMKASPEKMYLYIKDIVDELNMQRKFAKAQPAVNEVKSEEPVATCSDESKYDSKRQRQIRKLEKTIKKLHRAIQKLEEQEVDFEDEDDSVYLLTERYKERMVRVYAKFCQLSNTKMPSEPRIQIDARPGRPSGPAKRLEKWINKKVPIGTPLPFPDFHDVLRCVREANEADKLNFNEVDIMEEARDLFTRCGRKLQRRRQENEWRLAASRIASEVDPAENSDELKQKLNENKKIAANKETDIFNKYADRQNQLKLEAKEIGDKEAEESPVESEEEETNDDSVSLENTEKRKEILKRLLHEKTKKTLVAKENKPDDENQVVKENKSSNEGQKNDIEIKPTETKEEVDVSNKLETNDTELEKKKNDDSNKNTEEPNKAEGADTQFKNDLADENATETHTQSKNDQADENAPKTHTQSKNDQADENASETLILSDDSNELESDIDELHLLQKLHSGNEEHSSTVDTSDSDSPIAISDSLDSDEDNKDESDANDVISIENSSYSEGENEEMDVQETKTDNAQLIDETVQSQDATVAVPTTIDIEIPSSEEVHVPPQTNNDECNGAVEDILLASSDENSQDTAGGQCVNLRDDLISIDETVVGNINKETDIQVEKQGLENDETIS